MKLKYLKNFFDSKYNFYFDKLMKINFKTRGKKDSSTNIDKTQRGAEFVDWAH